MADAIADETCLAEATIVAARPPRDAMTMPERPALEAC
jgi:hypothetical protein